MKLTEIIKSMRASRQRERIASRRYTRSKFGTFLIFVILTAAGLFSVLPLIYCICTAFKPLDELLIFPPRFFVRRPTIANFTVLPSLISSLKVPFSRYIFNSLFITLATTAVYIFISMMAAFALSKATFRGKNFIFWLIQFALMFNGVTLGVQQYLIFAKLKIIDTYWVYILPQLASTLGVFLAKQYIEGYIPNPLLEAAKIDGANYYRVFWSIVMPIIKPAWLTLLLFIQGYMVNGSIGNNFQREPEDASADSRSDNKRRHRKSGKRYGGFGNYDHTAADSVFYFAKQCCGSNEQRRN